MLEEEAGEIAENSPEGVGKLGQEILKVAEDATVAAEDDTVAIKDVLSGRDLCRRSVHRLSRIEKQHPNWIYIYIGNAFDAEIEGGFSCLLVDLFRKGCLVPELRDPAVMVNVGGSCVEAKDGSDGREIMEETLNRVFQGEDDSFMALTVELPDVEGWKEALPKPLGFYA
ncbi:uncharacterized protein LOC130750572 [Actinidia eriantha]|uniref:uncharacterized protein LOC130750572 n=1 Tax=Actinidia eriantha TaxID=165200 RepID=UPI00258D027E|nr:uncharacterized protein LOC130750572 [Actinidia eriantha]